MKEKNTPIENTISSATKKEGLTSTQNEIEAGRPIEAVYDVPVVVSAVLGSAKMSVSDLLKLTRGSIVELERRIGDPVDIYVNNRLIAKGEVVSVDDKLAITMTEVIKILK
jgi:flagellar motor switch protein FliN/FliY